MNRYSKRSLFLIVCTLVGETLESTIVCIHHFSLRPTLTFSGVSWASLNAVQYYSFQKVCYQVL